MCDTAGWFGPCLAMYRSDVHQRRHIMKARRSRDFSNGPVWNPEKNRWLVEIRYPDGWRLRRRLRRKRAALRLWANEISTIKNGTWSNREAQTVTVATAFERYRDYAKVQDRAYKTYHKPAL